MILTMHKINLQVRLPEEIDKELSRLSPSSKSEFVRQAIEEKIRREKTRILEDQWIQALSSHPEDKKEAEEWLKAGNWGNQ